MSQQVRFCTSADGTKIAYAVSGKGPLLVMTTTWVTHLEHSADSLTWKPWLESLNREYTLVRYDIRGCGLSDRDVNDLSFPRWVEDLEAVVGGLTRALSHTRGARGARCRHAVSRGPASREPHCRCVLRPARQ